MPKTLALLGVILLLAAGGLGSGCDRPKPTSELSPPPVALLSELEKREGRLWAKGAATPFTGQLRENYPDGAVKAMASLRDGQIHGGVTGYFASGRAQIEEQFVSGVSEGTRRRFYEDGTLRSTEQIVAGKLHGPAEQYHTNGVLAERSIYRTGQPHGLAESWDVQGRPMARVVFEEGRVVEQTFLTNGIPDSGEGARDGGTPKAGLP